MLFELVLATQACKLLLSAKLSMISSPQHIVTKLSANNELFFGLQSEPESVVLRTHCRATITLNYLLQFKLTKSTSLSCYLAKYLP